MKNKAFSITNTVISAASAVAVNTALHPCRSEMAMKCGHTTQVGTVLLAALAVLSIAALLVKNTAVHKLLNGLSVLTAAAVFFVPVLGHCGGAMMHCNSHTMPAFRIAGAVLFVVSVIAFAAEFARKRQAGIA